MSDDTDGVAVASEHIEGIPLYLIPKTIAEEIKKKGHGVFQIHVERKFHHQYTVKVETLDDRAMRMNQEEPAPEEGDGHG